MSTSCGRHANYSYLALSAHTHVKFQLINQSGLSTIITVNAIIPRTIITQGSCPIEAIARRAVVNTIVNANAIEIRSERDSVDCTMNMRELPNQRGGKTKTNKANCNAQ